MHSDSALNEHHFFLRSALKLNQILSSRDIINISDLHANKAFAFKSSDECSDVEGRESLFHNN